MLGYLVRAQLHHDVAVRRILKEVKILDNVLVLQHGVNADLSRQLWTTTRDS